MSLLDDLAGPPEIRIGGRCGVAILYDRLEGDDLAAVRREIEGTRLNGMELAARLRRNGIQVSGDTIQRHRRRECKCPA